MLRFAKKNSAESGYNKSNGGEQHILYMDGPDQKAMNNKIVKACLTSCTQMTHVFVYGTLKKGQPNYHRMFDTAKGKTQFLASARTVEKYPLVIAGEYNIPFLLNIPGEGRRILGEIYGVDERMLEFLDAFEGVPAMYQRTTVKLEVVEWVGRKDGEESPSVGSVVHAFIYSTKTYQPDWPTLPNYDNYDSYGDHGLDYVTREARD